MLYDYLGKEEREVSDYLLLGKLMIGVLIENLGFFRSVLFL